MQTNGTDKLQKRAKRKYLAFPLVAHLLALDSPLKNKYLSTLACSSSIKTRAGKVQSRYCKRTWCAVCSPIRTAVRINNYREQLENLGDLQLTTLTAPNCKPGCILETITKFRQCFRQFRNSYKKRTGQVFRGVYNFEITYNHRTGLYHPHIHIIHECLVPEEKPNEWHSGKTDEIEYYNEIIRYWLAKNSDASGKAQDTRYCYDLIEGFKYQSLSIFKIKINGKKQPFIPVIELDIIYQAIAGVRCFQSFGIKKISEKTEEEQIDQLSAYNIEKPDGAYQWNVHDWFDNYKENSNDGSDTFTQKSIPLTGYIPNEKTITYYNKLQKNEYYKRE